MNISVSNGYFIINGDKIYPLIQRSSASGVYTLQAGSSVIVNKL